eukprot:2327493-Alexandrium_andersonii.AAC.1
MSAQVLRYRCGKVHMSTSAFARGNKGAAACPSASRPPASVNAPAPSPLREREDHGLDANNERC